MENETVEKRIAAEARSEPEERQRCPQSTEGPIDIRVLVRVAQDLFRIFFNHEQKCQVHAVSPGMKILESVRAAYILPDRLSSSPSRATASTDT